MNAQSGTCGARAPFLFFLRYLKYRNVLYLVYLLASLACAHPAVTRVLKLSVTLLYLITSTCRGSCRAESAACAGVERAYARERLKTLREAQERPRPGARNQLGEIGLSRLLLNLHLSHRTLFTSKPVLVETLRQCLYLQQKGRGLSLIGTNDTTL